MVEGKRKDLAVVASSSCTGSQPGTKRYHLSLRCISAHHCHVSVSFSSPPCSWRAWWSQQQFAEWKWRTYRSPPCRPFGTSAPRSCRSTWGVMTMMKVLQWRSWLWLDRCFQNKSEDSQSQTDHQSLSKAQMPWIGYHQLEKKVFSSAPPIFPSYQGYRRYRARRYGRYIFVNAVWLCDPQPKWA